MRVSSVWGVDVWRTIIHESPALRKPLIPVI
jgi:hypothetical protein